MKPEQFTAVKSVWAGAAGGFCAELATAPKSTTRDKAASLARIP
jgi:hypothetical protein